MNEKEQLKASTIVGFMTIVLTFGVFIFYMIDSILPHPTSYALVFIMVLLLINWYSFEKRYLKWKYLKNRPSFWIPMSIMLIYYLFHIFIVLFPYLSECKINHPFLFWTPIALVFIFSLITLLSYKLNIVLYIFTIIGIFCTVWFIFFKLPMVEFVKYFTGYYFCQFTNMLLFNIVIKLLIKKGHLRW
jgi:hypothetical protein